MFSLDIEAWNGPPRSG